MAVLDPKRIAQAPAVAVMALGILIATAFPVIADIDGFIGTFTGSAKVELSDGTSQDRDLRVEITENRRGFTVAWTTVTYRSDGRVKEQAQEISFVPSGEGGLYSAAMKQDLFGNAVQLDPMKGEPYVWGQLIGDTLTVYALFVDTERGYELHQYDRTLVDGGLQLDFYSIVDGERQRSISALLTRE